MLIFILIFQVYLVLTVLRTKNEIVIIYKYIIDSLSLLFCFSLSI